MEDEIRVVEGGCKAVCVLLVAIYLFLCNEVSKDE